MGSGPNPAFLSPSGSDPGSIPSPLSVPSDSPAVGAPLVSQPPGKSGSKGTLVGAVVSALALAGIVGYVALRPSKPATGTGPTPGIAGAATGPAAPPALPTTAAPPDTTPAAAAPDAGVAGQSLAAVGRAFEGGDGDGHRGGFPIVPLLLRSATMPIHAITRMSATRSSIASISGSGAGASTCRT